MPPPPPRLFTPLTCQDLTPPPPFSVNLARPLSLLPRSLPFKFRSLPLSKLLLKILNFLFHSLSPPDPHFLGNKHLELSSSSSTMVRLMELCSPLLLAFLLVQFSIVSSSSPPQPSPTPSPQPAADSPSPKSTSSISLPPSPSDVPVNSPHPSSPPAPPQSSPSQSPSADDTPPAPSPAPSNPSDIHHSYHTADGDGAKNSPGGMSPAKKAGVVVGVIVGVGVVGLAGFVYKKRQDNIRRSQYRYAARREIL